MIRFYNYYRSSASYRARIALHLKGLEFEYVPVHLLRDGGQHKQSAHTTRNPLAQVPTLEHNGRMISQSLAIMFYLDDLKPEPMLFSKDPYEKAKIFELCEIINSGIQPLHNLSVTAELGSMFQATKEQKDQWHKFWIEKGLAAFEKSVLPGAYSMGDRVTAADACLVAQLFSSRRFGADVEKFPRLLEIEKNCLRLDAFKAAEPARQIDAE